MTARLAAKANIISGKQQQQQQQQQTRRRSEESQSRPDARRPLMEKRRRARINQSLTALKALLVDSGRRHSKLEKADILEMTVRHLQRQRGLPPGQAGSYRAGFLECAREVAKFLAPPEVPGTDSTGVALIDQGARGRLLRHLEACAAELDDLDWRQPPDSSTGSLGDEPALLGASASTITQVNTNTVLHPRTGVRPKALRPKEISTKINSKPTTSENLTNTINQDPNQVPLVQNPACQVLPDGHFVFLLPSHLVQLGSAQAGPQDPEAAPPSTTHPTAQGIPTKAEEPLDCSYRPPDSPPAPASTIPLHSQNSCPIKEEQGIANGDPTGGNCWRPW